MDGAEDGDGEDGVLMLRDKCQVMVGDLIKYQVVLKER